MPNTISGGQAIRQRAVDGLTKKDIADTWREATQGSGVTAAKVDDIEKAFRENVEMASWTAEALQFKLKYQFDHYGAVRPMTKSTIRYYERLITNDWVIKNSKG